MRPFCVAGIVLAVLAPVAVLAAEEQPGTKAELKTLSAKFSYLVGQEMASVFQKMQVALDREALVRGLSEGLKGMKPVFTEQEVMELLEQVQKECTRKNEEFLEANKKKEGVITTKSGLQYMVIEEGKGPTPKETDRVRVHYIGTLIDGTEFDSSYKRGRPATFGVDEVITGWTEALQLMKVGGTYRLFLPAKIAYGDEGGGAKIGPGATLIFEVKLLQIEPETEKPKAPELDEGQED